MKIRFKDNVTINYSEGRCLISKGEIQFNIVDNELIYYNLFRFREWEREDISNEIFEFLSSENLIIKEYENDYTNTLKENNIYYFESLDYKWNYDLNKTQINIKNKNVLLLGCGGLGTVVLQNLISLGVEKLVLIDYDNIDISNLNRQLFFNENDVGKLKTDILKDKIMKINNKINVDTISLKIENECTLDNILSNKNIDMCINCADKPSNINLIIKNVCFKYKVPFIEGTVGIITGKWGPIVSDFSKEKITDIQPIITGNTIKGSISTTNMLIGAFIAHDVLNYFIGNETPLLFKRKIFNFNRWTISVEEN